MLKIILKNKHPASFTNYYIFFNLFFQIDILVNNAGYSQRAEFQDIDIEVDLKLFNVNVFGSVNLTRKVLKHFIERGKGHIVVTSSLAGKIGNYVCVYCFHLLILN